ncbi:hypothetical protein GIB67_024720 [Kingdonia uniflora]|uniref:RING-type E3 ubiquitin transferase n=1 Tax=Kingdonia uniflora TaxID=39325 RepID=A0A7J7N9L1_9MAGN|nr:hypothetical protein GIB67_024720 [Kingdonia uniflora]
MEVERPSNRHSHLMNCAMLVREISTFSFEDLQTDWSYYYSNPVFVLDVIWNLAFVFVSTLVLSSTPKENPSTPLRIWISGYAFQCLLHVGFVCFVYRLRNSSNGGHGYEGDHVGIRFVKKLESMNTMVSFFWWVIGFFWIVKGGQALLQDAPRLYWLALVFLAFDAFFAICCIALACIIGVALCCCLPCIFAILYAVKVHQGASEDDIKNIPRHKFRQIHKPQISGFDKKQEMSVERMEQGTCDSMCEISLPPEDSKCCICLSKYVEGAELHTLPCNHHFHCGCLVKWLRINATCPLCKFNILNGGDELV